MITKQHNHNKTNTNTRNNSNKENSKYIAINKSSSNKKNNGYEERGRVIIRIRRIRHGDSNNKNKETKKRTDI